MDLTTLLDDVTKLRGVKRAALVSGDGLVMESAPPDEDLGFVGGLITSGLAASRVLSSFLGDGELSQAMLEYDEGPVLLIPLAAREEAPVLVATLESSAVLGRVRLQLRKLLPEIKAAVGA